MDSINVEKIQALKRYKQQQSTKNLMFYPIVALTCGIFLTSPFWFPSLYSYIKTFVFVSIPRILSFFFNAKSLFIVGNLIVIFLLGESKIKPRNSSLPRKIDPVKRRKVKQLRRNSVPEIEVHVEEKVEIEAATVAEPEPCRGDEEEQESAGGQENVVDVKDEGEEVIPDLSPQELNRRADNFIAMVNKQMKFEAENDLHEVLLHNC